MTGTGFKQRTMPDHAEKNIEKYIERNYADIRDHDTIDHMEYAK